MCMLGLHRVGAIVKELSNACTMLVYVIRDLFQPGLHLSDRVAEIVQVGLQRNVCLLL